MVIDKSRTKYIVKESVRRALMYINHSIEWKKQLDKVDYASVEAYKYKQRAYGNIKDAISNLDYYFK